MHSYTTFNMLVSGPIELIRHALARQRKKKMDAILQYWPKVGDIVTYTGKDGPWKVRNYLYEGRVYDHGLHIKE